MATVNDLIKATFRKLNVVGVNGDPSANQLSEGLDNINRMLSMWNTDGLIKYYIQRETFNFVAGQQSYTIGSGGDFNTVRPVEILEITTDSSGITYRIDLVNYADWMRITNKSESEETPSWAYYEPSYPLGRVYFWGKPTSTNSVVIASEKPFSAFSNGDTVSLPPGYEKAVIDNLALELFPMYPSESLYPILQNQAQNSIALLKRVNSKNKILTLELGFSEQRRRAWEC